MRNLRSDQTLEYLFGNAEAALSVVADYDGDGASDFITYRLDPVPYSSDVFCFKEKKFQTLIMMLMYFLLGSH